MKFVLPLLVLLALLWVMDWQQRWRGESLLEDQGDISACREESPCLLRSVQADMCTLFARNRSFLVRTFRADIQFEPEDQCGRGGRYDVHYWVREG